MNSAYYNQSIKPYIKQPHAVKLLIGDLSSPSLGRTASPNVNTLMSKRISSNFGKI